MLLVIQNLKLVKDCLDLTSSSTNATVPEPETFAQDTFSSTGILRNIQEEIIATRNGRIEVTK